MKKIFFAAAVIISSTAQAQRDTSLLETVMVTANKIEQKQNETGKVLTVITREELERNNSRSIGELLNRQVGIVITGASNNAGSNETVYVRGASSANTLIMLDGVPLNDASGVTGEFDLNTFAPDQLERIEILKGAQSVLYGSDAVAGVINFISRKPEKGLHANGLVSAGSFGNFRSAFALRGINDCGIQYNAGWSMLSSNGFSAAYDSTGKGGFDHDGFEKHVFQFGLGYSKIKNLDVNFYGKYNINRSAIDAGAFTDDKDYTYKTENTIYGANLKYRIRNSFVALLYNHNKFSRNYLDDSTDVAGVPYKNADPFSFIFQDGRFEGRSHFAELYGNIHINASWNLVAGTDYRRNATTQSYSYAIKDFGIFSSLPLSRDTAHTSQTSGYASLLYKSTRFIAGAGARYNHHSVYGNVTTWSLNPAYLVRDFKFFGNISSAYRVPSIYQLYSEFGNRNLKPEQSVNLEGGVQYTGNKISARAVGFSRDIKDVFSFYFDNTTFTGMYINEDRQKDNGIELELTTRPAKALTVTANYSYTSGKLETKTDLGKDTSFFNLYRRPKHIINASVGYQVTNGFYARLSGRNVSSFYEAPVFGMGPSKLDGYLILNLYAEYRFPKYFRMYVDLQNLGDKKYFDQAGFNTKPFNLHSGLIFSL